jgi:acetyl esterase/lipase
MTRIELWNQNEIPYYQEGDCIPAIEIYPAEHAKGAVVVCPGGAYAGKAAHEGEPIARMFNEAGITGCVLDYRIRPCHHEAPLNDALRAIRLLRSMGYEKVGIIGFSAGGHLVCSAATLYDTASLNASDPVDAYSSRPDAFIPCYGVSSFISFRKQASVGALLGDKRNDWPLLRRFSAEMNVTENTPPAFIWHTAADDAVSVEHALILARALAFAEVSFEMHVFPNGGHGLGLAKNNPAAAQWAELCRDWLKRLGFAD